jgi:vacuolar-type H+-ATPase subunit H|tara:strand:+ start:17491 stop:18498 length:1008 start_codon:yes stop_codon:yes gene_type:complete
MKTFIKIAAIIIVLVVLGFVALIAFGLSQADAIVKAAIERGGTYATQTTTTVDDVHLGITDGTFEMNGLTIANPAGFSSDHFFKLAGTNVKLDTASITSNIISVPSVSFDGIDVILDKGKDPSNYNTILNSLKRFENSDTKAAPENQGGKKVTIDTLTLNNIDIRVANMPGVSLLTGDVAINIPTIELKDIGKDKPMTTAEVVNLVIKTVLTAAVEAGGGILPTNILGELGNGLSSLSSLSDMGITVLDGAGQIIGDNIGNVLDGAGKAVDDITNDAQKAIDNATKDLPAGVGDGLKDATKGATEKAEEAVEEAKEEIEKGLNNLFGGKKKKEDD